MTYRLELARSGYWEIRWSERVEGAGGSADGRAAAAWRSRSTSCRTQDRAEAEAFLRGFVTERERIAAAARDRSVAGVVGAYLEDRPRVGDAHRAALGWVVRLLGDLPPVALSPDRLREYRQRRGVADGTLRRELGALNAALAHAVRHRRLDPAERPHIDLPPPGAPRDLWLDEQEEAEAWALAQATSRNKPRLSRIARFVAIALDTAARKEAIETLTWDRVDLAGGLLDFRDPGRAITNKRRVPVPIADRLMPVLERARWEHARDGGPPVVVGPGSIRKAFDLWTGSPGFPFPWLTPHVLRHTWATLAARRGVSMFEIAGVLGDSVETVTRHYVHHAPGYLRTAVNRPSLQPPQVQQGVSP